MTVLPLREGETLLSRHVANRTRGLLAERGLKQSDLGRYLGLSTGSVSERLRCATPFTLDEVPKVADFFGVSDVYLMGYTDDRQLGFAGRGVGGNAERPRLATGPSESVRQVGLEPTTRWLMADHAQLAPVIGLFTGERVA